MFSLSRYLSVTADFHRDGYRLQADGFVQSHLCIELKERKIKLEQHEYDTEVSHPKINACSSQRTDQPLKTWHSPAERNVIYRPYNLLCPTAQIVDRGSLLGCPDTTARVILVLILYAR